MSIPNSKEMGDALRSTGKALKDSNLITSDHVFCELKRVLSLKEDSQWEYAIHESNPIEFRPIYNNQINGDIRPRIYASISVKKSASGGVCFKRLDLAVEVINDEGNVLIKHHIDLANSAEAEFQQGPIFHLQFGGHTPKNSRSFEVPIKEPRWLCIPMDVVLLCEVIVANFYPEAWEKLKNQPGWNGPIITSQRFCITPFVNELQKKLGVPSRTLADHLWASSVGPAYVTQGFC